MKYFPVASQSLMQTGNWNRTFPLKIQTEKEANCKVPFLFKKSNYSVKSLIICYGMQENRNKVKKENCFKKFLKKLTEETRIRTWICN